MPDTQPSRPTSGHDPQAVLARLRVLQASIGSLTDRRDELLTLASDLRIPLRSLRVVPRSTASRRIRRRRDGGNSEAAA